MAKTPKRKARPGRISDAVDLARRREEADLRRYVRHQQKIRQLNRALTNAIRAADASIVQLHAFLSSHPSIAEVPPITDESSR